MSDAEGVALPALRGSDLLGFLAALGVLRLVTEELDCPSATLSWPNGPWNGAVLGGTPWATSDAVAEAIAAVAAEMRSVGALLPGVPGFPIRSESSTGADPMRSLSFADGRGLSTTAVDEPTEEALARWINAIVATDTIIESKGGTVLARSRFFGAGPGTVWIERTLSKALDGADPVSLQSALVAWRRVDSVGAYLDHRADRDDALGQSSLKKPLAKYGEPGATWLALMALPLFTSRSPEPGVVETAAWTHPRRLRKGVHWATWARPLGLDAVRSVVDHPVLAQAARERPLSGRTHGLLAGLGISAVFRSVRMSSANSDAAMSAPTQLWPSPER